MAHKLYWTDPDSNEVVTVIFDAITTMTPEDTVDITEHPVEEGADVTDHARSKSGRLTIEGIIGLGPNASLDTDVGYEKVDLQIDGRKPGASKSFALDIPSPPVQFSESGLIQAGIGALKGALFGGPKAKVNGASIPSLTNAQVTVLQQDSPRNRIRDTYDTLLKVKDQHALITVLTLHRDHFDMMIERIAEPRTEDMGASAKFQIDLKQVRTVSSQQVQAPKPLEPRAQPIKVVGVQNAPNAGDFLDWQPGGPPPVSLTKQTYNYLSSVFRGRG